MSSTHSGTAQKVDDLLRIWWTICSGFSGRHAPDLADDMLRIMHLSFPDLNLFAPDLHQVIEMSTIILDKIFYLHQNKNSL